MGSRREATTSRYRLVTRKGLLVCVDACTGRPVKLDPGFTVVCDSHGEFGFRFAGEKSR